jgi:hypothetical protein
MSAPVVANERHRHKRITRLPSRVDVSSNTAMRITAKALRLDGPFAYALVAIVALGAVTLDYDRGRADLRTPHS